MNPEQLTKKYVLDEVRKLQYLYGLKHEIRYNKKRPEGLFTESVAEHVYGMHICAQYFLPLENSQMTWNKVRIYEMITLHDIDEVETGDMIGYLKTDEIRNKEGEARLKVLEKVPAHLQSYFRDISNEYEDQETIEAKFVKAIDRFEPLIQVYGDFGHHVIHANKTTADQSQRIKEPYVRQFSTMNRFNEVVHQAMIDEGFFNHSA